MLHAILFCYVLAQFQPMFLGWYSSLSRYDVVVQQGKKKIPNDSILR